MRKKALKPLVKKATAALLAIIIFVACMVVIRDRVPSRVDAYLIFLNAVPVRTCITVIFTLVSYYLVYRIVAVMSKNDRFREAMNASPSTQGKFVLHLV
ncbi:MAG: hypothetical protein VX367_02235, partial [SAR324 cluster bacterium]|nr:hypothetical protein [SAR324 cluster bacterium]